ncbi:MAG: B12-binding domain-containing radical SAM protein [Magnetococcales bacterium]|nr:B12-binding domain-containing radical SAM protein [Magnetococcales bacterium]
MNTLTFVTYLTRDMELMPVGPLTLATLARERGVDVTVVDLPAVPEEQEWASSLAQREVVGFSTLCSTFHRSLRLAGLVKALNPRVTVVMGGPQASAVAVLLLQRHGCVDLVFRGEAETGWTAFLDGAPWSAIPGLVYRQGTEILETPPAPLLMDLDRLPLPAFDLYRPTGISVPVETGRGCPFACTYCSTNEYFSRRFRAKSPGRILAEMDQLHALYGMRAFEMIEDSFTTNRRKIIEFCAAIGQHPRQYHWQISARPDLVDAELLEHLRLAGCQGIYFGMETGSQRMQKVVRKNLRVARAVDNILLTRHAGLATTVSFIIGFPDETEADVQETLRVFGTLSESRDVVLQMHLLSPLAGSALVAANTELAYDGMPTDFNESDERDALSMPDLERFREESGLFPHRHYFAQTVLPRGRYLFLAYGLRLMAWYFPNFLHRVFGQCQEAWIDYLLTIPVPEEMVRDPSFPEPMAVWSERGYALCVDFARRVDVVGLWELLAYDRAYSRVSHGLEETPVVVRLPRVLAGRNPGRLLPERGDADSEWASFVVSRLESGMVDVSIQMTAEEMERRLEEICGPCGECCLDEDGLMCGVEEWGLITQFLESQQQSVPSITPTAWQGLVLEGGIRYLAQTEDGERTLHETYETALQEAGEDGWVRHACAHLELEADRHRCALQGVKPAECVAYPYRPMEDGNGGWRLEPVAEVSQGRCALISLLRDRAMFREQYMEWATGRMGRRSGAVALSRMHGEEKHEQERRA